MIADLSGLPELLLLLAAAQENEAILRHYPK